MISARDPYFLIIFWWWEWHCTGFLVLTLLLISKLIFFCLRYLEVISNRCPNSARKLAYRLFQVLVQQQLLAFLASIIRSIVSSVGFLANCFLADFEERCRDCKSSWGLQSSLAASQSSEKGYCDILFSCLLLIYYYKNKSRAPYLGPPVSKYYVFELAIPLYCPSSPTSFRKGIRLSKQWYSILIRNTINQFAKL